MNELILKLNNTNGNSHSKDIHQNDRKSPTKKQKNVPAQIWAKRNILKKLTLQLKFNKNQTKQYKKIRTQIQGACQDYTFIKFKKTTEKKQKNIETNFSKNQKNNQQFINSTVQNNLNYNDKPFALNSLSLNGLKSFHQKSETFQRNNFINVSKALISQKNKNQPNTKPCSHRKYSFSHTQKDQQIDSKKRHSRSKSFSQNYPNSSQNQQNSKSKFLKVSSKKLHFNNFENSYCKNSQQSSIIFVKKFKTEADNNFTILFQRPKPIQNQTKLNLKRPKSCIVKGRKPVQLISCQGWNTKKSARQQEQPFPDYCQF